MTFCRTGGKPVDSVSRRVLLAVALGVVPATAVPWRYSVRVEEHTVDLIRVGPPEERRALAPAWRPPAGAGAVVFLRAGPRVRVLERGGPALVHWPRLWALWSAVALGASGVGRRWRRGADCGRAEQRLGRSATA